MDNQTRIRFLVMDVDGTLTDGKVYIGERGEAFKAFDVKDGYGIKEMLPQYNIIPIVITARQSVILENRCKELNITELHQGIREKYRKLIQIVAEFQVCNKEYVDLSQVAYIGDDILDMQCMIPIKKAGGLIGCPADAADDVREYAEYVCIKPGGNGAVREFIEYVIERKRTRD